MERSGKEMCIRDRIGADHLAKAGTANIAVDGLRSEELGMVEHVETFQPKLQRLRFGYTHVLEMCIRDRNRSTKVI